MKLEICIILDTSEEDLKTLFCISFLFSDPIQIICHEENYDDSDMHVINISTVITTINTIIIHIIIIHIMMMSRNERHLVVHLCFVVAASKPSQSLDISQAHYQENHHHHHHHLHHHISLIIIICQAHYHLSGSHYHQTTEVTNYSEEGGGIFYLFKTLLFNIICLSHNKERMNVE